jgi:hypothetical protein
MYPANVYKALKSAQIISEAHPMYPARLGIFFKKNTILAKQFHLYPGLWELNLEIS